VGHPLKQAKKCPDKQTSLVKKSRPCKSCHRNIQEKEGNLMKNEDVVKKGCCSSMGCAICKVLVCKECWREGHLHGSTMAMEQHIAIAHQFHPGCMNTASKTQFQNPCLRNNSTILRACQWH
jgi:hypothetical protein